jgi:carboxylesterase type B
MAMHSALLLSLCAVATAMPARDIAIRQDSTDPVVQVVNGSYSGIYRPDYNQDYFLGIPYAQPPVEELRFSPPQPLNESWSEVRNATEYSPQCFGYGSDTWVLGNYVSEDCLTINVVRPHGVEANAQLPVAFWIHGGGLTNGGSSDPRYNLSFIVQQSVEMGTPIVAVSINYRLHAWGFIWSSEIEEAGAGNLGFRDQRLALEWVNQNIAAFGGDPEQVTIWGESAGARSVATQLVAYDGRDDGLFKAAIQQSGTGVTTDFGEGEEDGGDAWQEYFDSIVNQTNCSSAEDRLQCLRGVPTWTLSDIINGTDNPSFGAVVDGDFLTDTREGLIKQGMFVKVPVLIGANFDEGTMSAQKGINTTDEWNEFLASTGAGKETATVLSALYPDVPSLGLPATLEGRPKGQYANYGSMWKRVVSFSGDRGQHAPRRWFARELALAGVPVYSYHFNVLVNGLPPVIGATHFQEVAFVFDNTEGLGYETVVAENPYAGKPDTFLDLANIMSRMWVSFFVHGDPNQNNGKLQSRLWDKALSLRIRARS